MRESALETAGIFGCGNAEDAEKGTAHGVGGFEAAGVRYLFEAARGAVDNLLRCFDAHTVDKLAGVHSCFPETNAREMTGAHADALGERFDGEIFTKMLDHPNLKLSQWLRGDGLMREHVAVLRLSAGTHEEHDEVASDLEGGLVSVILLHQGKREVNAGGDTCRSVD
jgi:hypothetical protein